MKRILFVLIIAWMAVPAGAKTVAGWDFEDGTEGTPFYNMPQQGSVGWINDIVMFGYDVSAGPSFSAETYSGTGLSAYTTSSQDGYTTDETLSTWAPLKWTIEISFRITSSYGSTYRTLIGRDGTSYDGSSAATFYFQRRGSGSGNYALRLSYAIAEGEHVECLSSFIPALDQWYHAALVCDGLQVRMYIDSMDGSGYQLIKSTDLDPSKDNRLLVPNNGDGGIWTFGRGWYNGDSADNMTGYFDDIRFSDEALTPAQFLHTYDSAWNPAPGDGQQNYGTRVDDEKVSASLSWNTGLDPNDLSRINDQILMHYVYMSKDQHLSNDANLYSIADIPVTGAAAEITLNDLNYDGLYLWRVDEGIDNGTASTYPKGDPNNLIGKVWRFGSLLSVPVMTLQPENRTVEAGQTVVFNVEAQSISTVQYQWYKSQDTMIDPENDEPLGSPALSGQLELTGVSISDEAYYYCQVFNDSGVENACYSNVVRLVMSRQLAHLPLDELTGAVSPDIVGDYDLTLMNDFLETNLSTLAEGVNEQNGSSLLFDNTVPADPNFYGQYAQFETGIVNYEDITIAMWVNWKGGDTYQHIFDFASSSTQYLYITPKSDNDELHFSIKNNSSSQYLDASSLAVNEWVHIAITINGNNTTGCLYVNGERMDTNTGMTYRPVDFSPTSNYLAGSSWSTDPLFNGMIDNVQIFNFALTEMDVARLFIADAPGKKACIQSMKPGEQFDYNDDCVVNIEDFATFASHWLDCALMPECIQ